MQGPTPERAPERAPAAPMGLDEDALNALSTADLLLYAAAARAQAAQRAGAPWPPPPAEREAAQTAPPSPPPAPPGTERLVSALVRRADTMPPTAPVALPDPRSLLDDLLVTHTQLEVQHHFPLPLERVAELKQTQARLARRLDALQDKLALEQRIRSATAALRTARAIGASFSEEYAASAQVAQAMERTDRVMQEHMRITQQMHDIDREILQHHTAVLRDRLARTQTPPDAAPRVAGAARLTELGDDTGAEADAPSAYDALCTQLAAAVLDAPDAPAPASRPEPEALVTQLVAQRDALQARVDAYAALDEELAQVRAERDVLAADALHAQRAREAAERTADEQRSARTTADDALAAHVAEHARVVDELHTALAARPPPADVARERAARDAEQAETAAALAAVRAQYADATAELEAMQKAHADAMEELTALHEALGAATQARDAAATEAATARAAHQDAVAERDVLRASHDATTAELDGTKQAHSSAVDELERLRAAHAEATDGLAALQQALAGATEELDEAKQARVQATEALDALRAAHTAATDELEGLRTAHAEATGELESVRGAHSAAATELGNVRTAHASASDELDALRVAHEQALDELSTLRTAHASATEELGTLRTAHANATEELGTLRTAHSAATEELGTLRTAHSAATEELDTLRSAHANATEELGTLRSAHANATEELGTLRSAHSAATEELDTLRSAHANATEELGTLRSAHANATEELGTLRSAHSAATEELGTLRTAHTAATEELDTLRSAHAAATADATEHRRALEQANAEHAAALAAAHAAASAAADAAAAATVATAPDAVDASADSAATARDVPGGAPAEPSRGATDGLASPWSGAASARPLPEPLQLDARDASDAGVLGCQTPESSVLSFRTPETHPPSEGVSARPTALPPLALDLDSASEAASPTASLSTPLAREAPAAASAGARAPGAPRSAPDTVPRRDAWLAELARTGGVPSPPRTDAPGRGREARTRYLEMQLDKHRRAAEQSRAAYEELKLRTDAELDRGRQQREVEQRWADEWRRLAARLEQQDRFCARVLGKDDGREEMDELLSQIKAPARAGARPAAALAERSQAAADEFERLIAQLEEHISDMAEGLARAGASGLGGNVIAQLEDQIEDLQAQLAARDADVAALAQTDGARGAEAHVALCVYSLAMLSALLPARDALALSMSLPLPAVRALFAPDDPASPGALDALLAAHGAPLAHAADLLRASGDARRAESRAWLARVREVLQALPPALADAVPALLADVFARLVATLNTSEMVTERAMVLEESLHRCADSAPVTPMPDGGEFDTST
ncbi:hypothetical protein MBRA1_003709 [Malassezia brasiliensis]|uniref:Up-regulated during septation protein 1 domain-containing protein n=1 Tax=Malassezia brasiliensis TaxID=1821822 RepID=A0AAF0DX65_9BASI|nr:hypothetical protein MBRA1_003709 [Malassezia brasiliensis]